MWLLSALELQYLGRDFLVTYGEPFFGLADPVEAFGELTLSPSGDVLPCAYRRHLGVGNVGHQSLSQVWSSEAMVQLRDDSPASLSRQGGDSVKKLDPSTGYLTLYGLQASLMHFLGPYLMLWMRSKGLTFTEIGLTQAAYMGAMLLLDFPTGGLADKYGRRLSYGAGMFLFGLGYTIVALSRVPLAFILGFALAGCGSAFTSGSLSAWYYDSVGEQKAAYSTFSKASIVEGIVGPVCGIVASAVSLVALNLPIGLSAAAGLTSSFVAIVFLRENYGRERDRSYRRILRDGVSEVLANKPLLYLILSGLFMSFVMPSFMLYWIIVLRDHGLPEASSGIVYTVLILSMTLGGFISQRLAKRVDFRRVAVLASVGWAVTFFGVSLSHSLVLLVVLFVLIEIVYALRSAAVLTYEHALVSPANRAVVFSFLGTLVGTFGLVANLVIGEVADLWGVGWLYRLAALFTLLAALSIAAARRAEAAVLRKEMGQP